MQLYPIPFHRPNQYRIVRQLFRDRPVSKTAEFVRLLARAKVFRLLVLLRPARCVPLPTGLINVGVDLLTRQSESVVHPFWTKFPYDNIVFVHGTRTSIKMRLNTPNRQRSTCGEIIT